MAKTTVPKKIAGISGNDDSKTIMESLNTIIVSSGLALNVQTYDRPIFLKGENFQISKFVDGGAWAEMYFTNQKFAIRTEAIKDHDNLLTWVNAEVKPIFSRLHDYAELTGPDSVIFYKIFGNLHGLMVASVVPEDTRYRPSYPRLNAYA